MRMTHPVTPDENPCILATDITPAPWLALKTVADEFASLHPRIPPIPRETLEADADLLLAARPGFRPHRKLLLLLLHNAFWRAGFASIPFSRRLLLLPQCLRHPTACRAEFDALGLICGACGQCSIPTLQAAAEKSGYAVLVAEGSTAVNLLLESGGIEAVLGVGCLASLEKLFPLIETAAIPSIAVPLDRDGCRDTRVCPDWVLEEMNALQPGYQPVPSPADLRREVLPWFEPGAWSETIGHDPGETPLEAVRWMTGSGKRWRPTLFLGMVRALATDVDASLLARVGRAIECFHKASLIHDDIEDQDLLRDDAPALHARIGLPAALNVGDFLIGEGYRLLAGIQGSDALKTTLITIAAAGHRDLCIGQGLELGWIRAPGSLSVRQLLEIFSLKTAPAFSVALKMGAAIGGIPSSGFLSIDRFSKAIGIAWQIRDDLADPLENRADKPFPPHIMLALALDHSPAHGRALIEALRPHFDPDRFYPLLHESIVANGLRAEARRLQEDHLRQARATLQEFDRPPVKWLLCRILHRMFTEPDTPIPNPGSKDLSSQPLPAHADAL
jgi:geranylgeranyl diphosphate synthase type II